MLLPWETLSDVSTESLLIVFLVVGKVTQMIIVCASAPCFATCEVVLAVFLVVGKVAQMLIVCTSAPCFATFEVALAAALTSPSRTTAVVD